MSRISIHALRGEGDADNATTGTRIGNFNPRPPWGGRPKTKETSKKYKRFQSTPSVGRATSPRKSTTRCAERFQSTPSVGRATSASISAYNPMSAFQSTPSVGRATQGSAIEDPGTDEISIHALRGEGDAHKKYKPNSKTTRFQSTPSVGRATACKRVRTNREEFQSTPSVGRATLSTA